MVRIRKELEEQQKQITIALESQSFRETEKDLKEQLSKWSMIEKSIYKQKFRVQWLKLRDSNTKYFFAHIMKGRRAQNDITMLTQEHGTLLMD